MRIRSSQYALTINIIQRLLEACIRREVNGIYIAKPTPRVKRWKYSSTQCDSKISHNSTSTSLLLSRVNQRKQTLQQLLTVNCKQKLLLKIIIKVPDYKHISMSSLKILFKTINSQRITLICKINYTSSILHFPSLYSERLPYSTQNKLLRTKYIDKFKISSLRQNIKNMKFRGITERLFIYVICFQFIIFLFQQIQSKKKSLARLSHHQIGKKLPLLINEITEELPDNIDQWQVLRRDGLIVDKSLLILKIKKSKNLIITRPRGWGKSLNMSMLETFFTCPLKKDGTIDFKKQFQNRRLFLGDQLNLKVEERLNQLSQKQRQQIKIKQIRILGPLQIAKHWKLVKEDFSNYISLRLNLLTTSVPKIGHFQSSINAIYLKIVLRAYQEHDYLKNSQSKVAYEGYLDGLKRQIMRNDEQHIVSTNASQFIRPFIQILGRHHQRQIFVTIDQYDDIYNSVLDIPTQQQPRNMPQIYQYLSDYITFILVGVGKNLKPVYRLVVTGINNIVKLSGTSSNSIEFQTIFSSPHTAQFYGFKEEQIKQQLVFKKFKSDSQQKIKALTILMQNIKIQYNGYQIRKLTLFNPFSITKYINTCSRNLQVVDVIEIYGQLNFLIQNSPSHKFLSRHMRRLTNEDLKFMAFLFKLLMNDMEDIEDLEKLIENLQQLDPNRTLINKSDVLYQRNDMIYIMIITGYLTIKDNRIMIPNQQVKQFIDQTLHIFLQNLLNNNPEKIDKRLNLTERSQFNIVKFQQHKHAIENVINQRLTKFFINFYISIFNAICLIQLIASGSCRNFKIAYEKRNIFFQTGMVLIPFNKQINKQLFIHEFKVISGTDKESDVEKKLQQAVFQIFHKNYFRIIEKYEEQCQGIQTVYVRGIIGALNTERKMKISIKECSFTRQEVKFITWYSDYLFQYQDNSTSLKSMVLLHFATMAQKQDTLLFFKKICQKYSLDIYQQNKQTLDEVEKLWIEELSSQKPGRLERIYLFEVMRH